MRCFIAIELPIEIKESIYSATARMREAGFGIKWVSRESLHITLKFLGEVPESRIEQIREGLSSVAPSHESFSISFSDIGAFPNTRRPRVVWVGVRNPEKAVLLRDDIEVEMAKLGFEKEDRSYSPHLTLGRVKSPRLGPRGAFSALEREIATFKDTLFGTIDVGGISLMKSELKPGGAVYERVFELKLGS